MRRAAGERSVDADRVAREAAKLGAHFAARGEADLTVHHGVFVALGNHGAGDLLQARGELVPVGAGQLAAGGAREEVQQVAVELGRASAAAATAEVMRSRSSSRASRSSSPDVAGRMYVR